jgi:phosphoserine phosphatase
MRIYLVRHGETEWNREGVFRGRKDFPLNETGRAQARKTGDYFAGKDISRIYSSPLTRALETAAPIGAAAGCPVTSMEEFTDMAFGVWEGLTIDEARTLLPLEYETWQTAPQRFRIEGGESLAGVRRRVARGLSAVLSTAGGDAVIVTHRVVCKVLTLCLLGVPNSRFWTIRCDPCSITLAETSGTEYVFHVINDTCHLRAEGTARGYKDF